MSQVCYYLMVGQIKSVKTVLKQLQQCIQTITAPGWPADDELSNSAQHDQFVWMPKEHLCVLVYLITVMHSMQVGLEHYNVDRIVHYYESTNSRLATWTRLRSTLTRQLSRSRS